MIRFINQIKKLFIYELILLPICIALDINKINNILLEEHNKYRKIHNSKNITIDKDIINKAQVYAQSLASNSDPYYLESSGSYSESGEKYGENLYQCHKKTCKLENWTQPANIWYNEISNYDFSLNKSQPGTYNFTQMIWKKTKKMGCGVGQIDDDSYKIVCFYYPKGNVYNKYGDNVLPANNSIIEQLNAEPQKEYGDYNDFINSEDFLRNKMFIFLLILCFLFVL